MMTQGWPKTWASECTEPCYESFQASINPCTAGARVSPRFPRFMSGSHDDDS